VVLEGREVDVEGRIRGRQKVRSREVQILKVERLVLKKKRECEREEGRRRRHHEGL
jgi:hypothetical protein